MVWISTYTPAIHEEVINCPCLNRHGLANRCCKTGSRPVVSWDKSMTLKAMTKRVIPSKHIHSPVSIWTQLLEAYSPARYWLGHSRLPVHVNYSEGNLSLLLLPYLMTVITTMMMTNKLTIDDDEITHVGSPNRYSFTWTVQYFASLVNVLGWRDDDKWIIPW